MVYSGLFHPCEQRANISDIDQDKELALVLLWQTPIFSLPNAYQSSRSAHRLEASYRSTGVRATLQQDFTRNFMTINFMIEKKTYSFTGCVS